jgi:hypothetical protein
MPKDTDSCKSWCSELHETPVYYKILSDIDLAGNLWSWRLDLKMTPVPTFLKNETLEKIFDTISDEVKSLKN